MLLLCCGLLAFSACKKVVQDADSGDSVDVEATAEAVKLIADANDNLKRIKILYYNSRSKSAEFQKALENRDSEKVKKIADELSLMINDGYILAENAKKNISEAQEENINQMWREYLGLKETSLDLQIKAFGFQRESAELFSKKFGGENEAMLKLAQRKYIQNDENFKKYMEQAKKKNKEANDLAKRAAQQDDERK